MTDTLASFRTRFACPAVLFELHSGGTGAAVEGLDGGEQAEVAAASIPLTARSLDCSRTDMERDKRDKGKDDECERAEASIHRLSALWLVPN